jgi:acyl carrier protein
MKEINHMITDILVEKLGIAATEITPEANFMKDLGIDSLDYAELVMELEQAFDITIPDNEAEKIKTVGQAIAYVEEKQKD